MLPRHTRKAILVLNLGLFLAGMVLLSSLTTSRGRSVTAPAKRSPLHLRWQRQLPKLDPTWPDQPRFTSDAAYRPVLAEGLVLFASSRHDSVTALDDSGKIAWVFRCNGPVRFAPAVWQGHAYVTSDDGHLYCLALKTGKVAWKFQGGPGERRILGNERLINTWPARGGAVVAGDGKNERATVYFAAGIWPFMGIFLHALDARTGKVRWTNSGDSCVFIKQPHNTDAFAGIAPQGSLAVAGKYLLVPGGRSVPACYDRLTGKLVHYELNRSNKRGGGPDVQVGTDVYLNGGSAFALNNGHWIGTVGDPALIDGQTLYSATAATLRVYDLTQRPRATKEDKAKAKNKKTTPPWLPRASATINAGKCNALAIQGKRLYVAGGNKISVFVLPVKDGAKPIWQTTITGTTAHLATDDNRLIVSTREGTIFGFDHRKGTWKKDDPASTPLPAVAGWPARVKKMLAGTSVTEGYAAVWGAGSGGMIRELLQQSNLRLIVLEPDADKVEGLRKKLEDANLDSRRVAVIQTTFADAQLPPYLFSLMVSETGTDLSLTNDALDRLFASLRPYGGLACLPIAKKDRDKVVAWAGAEGAGRPTLVDLGDWLLIKRPGALPGSANWTHQHADASNTRVSRDKRVKAPLGLLWFGGAGNQGILPRHGHGPMPQVAEGRLFIEGIHSLRALDIYSGRLLWERKLPNLGLVYNNEAHQPGANAMGSNYVSLPDGVFVAHGTECLQLDPATGKTLETFKLPPMPGEKKAPHWNFIAVHGRYLVGGTSEAARSTPKTIKKSSKKKKGKVTTLRGPESSQRLTVLDRTTGKELWSIFARGAFRHNAVCIGNDKLYTIDREPFAGKAKDKDMPADPPPARLLAFDLRSGRERWRCEREVFGTWLSYSEQHDVLVEAGLVTRDTLGDEPVGMRAFDGGKGKFLWHRREFIGPALIRGETILKSATPGAGAGSSCDLKTGRPIRIEDPLTGDLIDWKWVRTYGCNTPAASEHLVTFRSGAAGYFDLCNEGGTGNLGGFRSSCTNNLMVAGGIMTVPDYTRTCICSYQQQTSLALVHMPDVEMWTFTTSRPVNSPIKRLGLNLGAPGSRKAENGTLWLEFPAAGGPSPKVNVKMDPVKPERFRVHSSTVKGQGAPWVVSSGVKGVKRLTVLVAAAVRGPRPYTVKLYFIEPDGLGAAKRSFDVWLQGKMAVKGLDISKAAGGPWRGLEKTFKGVRIDRELTVTLERGKGSAETVLCGIELVAED